ncbi:MAG: cupin domain-containing protein [Patescibacteria group bacterium]
MLIKKKKQQVKFKSPVCGFLIDIIKTGKFGIVKAENIGITGRHYHKKTTEVYYLLSGEIVVEVKEKNKKEKKVKLEAGDVLVLQPYDIHKIIKASDKNQMIVTCVPDWQEEDEINVE